jgi:uncharacterized membrane protein
MWDLKIFGVSLYHIINWFFVYSFLGWMWESCYVSVKEKRWVNRGFVTGPLCTIYGCGALSVYLLLWPYKGNFFSLYLGGFFVATILEYFTAWLMEKLFHASWWDYSKQPFNIKGRICLGSSLGWGFFTIILFYVFQPIVEKIVDSYPVRVGHIVIMIVMCLHLVDLLISGFVAFGLREKLEHMEEVFDELSEYLQSTKFYETTEEMRTKIQNIREHYRTIGTYKRQSKRLESLQTLLADYFEQHGLKEYKEEVLEKFSNLSKRIRDSYKESNVIKKRMLIAYPNLKSLSRKAKDVAIHRIIRRKK